MKYVEFMGPIVRFHREKKEISIGTVCIQTGIQKPQYMAIEEGRKEVLLNTWKRICDVIDLDFVYLFKQQEMYDQLYEMALHALLYDDMEEQKRLYEQLNTSAIIHSIMMPKFALLKFIYCIINQESIDFKALMYYLDYFKASFSLDEQRLYQDYLGFYYQEQKEYERAMQYYKHAQEIAATHHLDIVYYHMGMLYYKMNEPMVALFHFQKAYQGFEKSWNVSRLLYTNGSIGICYSRMGEYQLAESQMKETLNLARQYHNDYVILNTYDNMCFNSFKMRDYEACILYGKEALQRNSQYEYLYFYLSYSSARLHKEEECENWLQQSQELQHEETMLKLLDYVRKMRQKHQFVAFAKHLYEHLAKAELFELQKFLLIDMANHFHDEASYENESLCLRELFAITQYKLS